MSENVHFFSYKERKTFKMSENVHFSFFGYGIILILILGEITDE